MDQRKANLQMIAQGGRGITPGEQSNAQSLLEKLYRIEPNLALHRDDPQVGRIFAWLENHEWKWKKGWASTKASPLSIAREAKAPTWMAQEIMEFYLRHYPANKFMYKMEGS